MLAASEIAPLAQPEQPVESPSTTNRPLKFVSATKSARNADLLDLNDMFAGFLAASQQEIDLLVDGDATAAVDTSIVPPGVGFDIAPMTAIPSGEMPVALEPAPIPSDVSAVTAEPTSLAPQLVPQSAPPQDDPRPVDPPDSTPLARRSLPSSLGFSLSLDHQPASIPFHGRPGMGHDAGELEPTKAKFEEGDEDRLSAKRLRQTLPTSMKLGPTLSATLAPTLSSAFAGAGGSGGSLSEQQRVERRERNREHAKRSRIRKKFLLESLQDQVQSLRNENMSLRRVVNEQMPEKASEILELCTTEYSCMLAPEHGSPGRQRELVEQDYNLIQALLSSQQCFAVSDPSLPDNPIVYVSGGFLTLTGYSMDRVLGRNCRFLQGPGTDQRAVDVIRQGVAAGRDTAVCLLNYKADGTPFWNQFFVAALRDAGGAIVNFVGVQCEVSAAAAEEHAQRYRVTATTSVTKRPADDMVAPPLSRGVLINSR